MQKEVALRFQESDLSLEDIRYVAGFEVTFVKDKAFVGAVVLDAKTMQIVEKKALTTKAPMNYVPGLGAFRSGPVICQLYYDLEYDPDVLFIVGEGICHETKCGTASFVGVELAKPTIGIAKDAGEKELQEDTYIVDGEALGRLVKTRDFANPVFVSVGNLINLDVACEIVRNMIVPPHKMPEPLHIARKIAKKEMKENRGDKKESQRSVVDATA